MQFQFCSSFPFGLELLYRVLPLVRDLYVLTAGNVWCDLDSMVVVMLFDPGGFLCEPWAAVVSILFYQDAGIRRGVRQDWQQQNLQSFLRG